MADDHVLSLPPIDGPKRRALVELREQERRSRETKGKDQFVRPERGKLMVDTRVIVSRVERPSIVSSIISLGAFSYEGDENTVIQFTVNRAGGFSQVVSVDWVIANASVTPSFGTATFQEGDGEVTFLVTASEVASTEVGSLTLSNELNLSGGVAPTLAAPFSASFIVTNVVVVTDINISLSAASYSGNENTNIFFTVNRAGGESTDIVTADWAITGVATVPTTGTVTFNIGETQKVIPVAAGEVVVDDVGALALSNPQNLSAGVTPSLIVPSSATFTVLNAVAASAPILDAVTLGSGSNLPSSPGSNNSGIAYDADNDEYQVTIQSGGNCDRYSLSGSTWTHEGNVSASTSSSDTEGITWVSGTRYAQSNETGGDDHIFIMNNNGSPLTATNEQEHTPGIEGGSNTGLEGITYASEAELSQAGLAPGLHNNGVFFGVVEARRAFRFEAPPFDGNDYHWNYPTSGDALATVTEFTGPGGQNLSTYLLSINCDDLAGVVFDPRNNDGRLVCVCERSGRILFEFTIGGANDTELTYAAELDLTNVQWEGICKNADGNYVIVEENGNAAVITYIGSGVIEETPVIAITSHVVAQPIATVMNKTMALDSGGPATWYIKKGPPSATIDPVSGAIAWIPSADLPRGQGVSFRIGCYNSFGHATPVSFIVHVNNTGQTGTLHVTGLAGININIGPAAEQMAGGDTLVVTGTNRNIASTNDGAADDPDYINTFVRGATGGGQFIAPGGTNAQLTTICAEDPFLVVSGAPHAGFDHWTNFGLDMSDEQNGYVKFMDYTIREVGRKVADISTNNTFLEGMGFYDAANEFEEINGHPPQTYLDADAGLTSKAVVGHSGASNCLTELCHVGGNGRYMFQDGSSPGDNNIRRWCVARPDEHHGDQPRGGFLMYSVKGGRDYNCTLIDGDQEDFTSFYKNHAGAYALPATNDPTRPEDQERHRCGTLNTHMAVFGLMDGNSGESQRASWDDHWAFNVENMSAPQSGNTGNAIIQSSSQYCDVNRASIGRAWNHNFSTRSFISGGSNNITNSILSEIGWNGTATQNMGSLFGSVNTFSGTVYDFAGSVGGGVTPDRTTNPHNDGWEYLPRVEPGSTLAVAGDGAQASFLKGKLYHRKGDVDEAMNTDIPAWPHPMEDVFRQHNKGYSKIGLVKRIDEFGGATGDISGDRGFCVDGETFTEYVWGYLGFMLPPLRITHRVVSGTVTFYNAPLESFRENDRTGWRVYKTTDLVNPVANVISRTGSVDVAGLTSGDYVMTNTFSTYMASNWMNGDESGQSIQTLTVTI